MYYRFKLSATLLTNLSTVQMSKFYFYEFKFEFKTSVELSPKSDDPINKFKF